MSKRMLVNAAQEGEVRVGIVENNVLEDLNVAIAGNELIKGNIYKAKVVSVESGLQAAFLDYGAERNGFITFNDIHPRYYNKRGAKKSDKKLKIQDAVKPGAELLVQVYKEEVGNKGAALTTDITLPGRYLVLMPFSDSGGVSRKIESEAARKKLKELIAKLNPPDDIGVIVRTAGQGRTKTELQKDFQAQLRLWGHAQARFEQLSGPGLVHAEPDVVIRSIRDYVTDDVTEIVVDDDAVRERLEEYFNRQASDIVERIKSYRGKMPIFSNFGLERQLENITSHKVPLPSGGSIVINPTEALTAVDVNSGKSRGQKNQEDMAHNTNLEAAVEVARQLRLRDLGGLVVIDFIDMYDNKNRRSVEKTLKQSMKRDKARVEVGRISKFGMLELSRQRVKARLISSTHNVCPMCEGSGFVMSTDVAAMGMLRRLQELSVSAPKGSRIRGKLPVPVALKLLNEHRTALAQLEQDFDVQIELIPEIGAVSTRDAFDIVKPGSDDKAKEERGDRRERRDRNRGGRGRRKSSSSRQTMTISEDADDVPYEPPKVVGFIDPEQLATADLGPMDEDTSEESAEPVSAEKNEDEGQGRRRRRRRRGRRGRGESSGEHSIDESSETSAAPEQPATDQSEETTDDDKARRRQAARERNRARRDARMNRTASESDANRDDESQRSGRSRRANRSAAQRLRASMKSEAPAEAPAVAPEEQSIEEAKPKGRRRGGRRKPQDAAEATPVPNESDTAATESTREAPSGRRRRGSGAAARLKAKSGTGDSSNQQATTEVSVPEADEAVTPSRGRRRKSGGAAAKLRAKLKDTEAPAEVPAETEAVAASSDAEAPRPRRSRKGSAAERLRSRAAGTTPESEEPPKRTRRTRKAAEEPEAPATPKRTRRTRKASAESDTEAKPKRTSRAKKAAEPAEPAAEAKPKRTSRAKKAAEPAEPAAEAKPKRTSRAKKAAEATESAAEAKPKRTSRAKKAAEPAAEATAEAKPKRASRSKKAAEPTEAATEAKPKRASRARKSTASKATEAEAKPKRASRAKKTAEAVEPEAEAKPKRARRTRKAAAESATDEAKPKRKPRARKSASSAETSD